MTTAISPGTEPPSGNAHDTATGPSNKRWCAWVLAGAYAAFSICAVYFYRFQINPDGVSYISLAQKYLAGDFHHAINAYWSPLFSWLLVPLLLLHVPPVIAPKVLGVMIGIATLAGGLRMARNLGVSQTGRLALAITLVPIVVYLAVSVIAPDLLSTTILLFYLGGLVKPQYLNNRSSGPLTGLLGAAAYLAKAYAFYFFLAHLICVSAIWIWRRSYSTTQVVTHAIVALLVLCLVSAGWVALLNQKYGHITLGSAGKINYEVNNPASPGTPQIIGGFTPPSNATAVCAWEDPTFSTVQDWSVLASTANLKYQLRLTHQIARKIFGILQDFSVLSIAIFLAALLIAGNGLEPSANRPILILIAAAAIYPCGYLLLYVSERYLSLIDLTLLILAVWMIDAASAAGRASRVNTLVVLFLVCLSFVMHPGHMLWEDRNTGREIHDKSIALSGMLPSGARIASDSNWADSQYIAFYLHLAYYGQATPGMPPENLPRELNRYQIEYFLVWNSPANYPFTQKWAEVSVPTLNGPHVYRVGPS